MPNWCSNRLSVTGREEEIDAFESTFRKGFSFGAFLPTPKDLTDRQSPFKGSEKLRKKLIAKYGFDEWYHWNVCNWGTKWDVDKGTEFERTSKKRLCTEFSTAWSPPLAALSYLSHLWPELKFTIRYKEEGMGFSGKETFCGADGEDSGSHEMYIERSRKILAAATADAKIIGAIK